MGIGLHPDVWQSGVGGVCSLERHQVPDLQQMLTKRNTNLPKGPCGWAHYTLWVGEGWGWQVLNCIRVEHAVMGISRFMILVRKLTSQSCFLFCSYNVNEAPSCLSCNYPKHTKGIFALWGLAPSQPGLILTQPWLCLQWEPSWFIILKSHKSYFVLFVIHKWTIPNSEEKYQRLD